MANLVLGNPAQGLSQGRIDVIDLLGDGPQGYESMLDLQRRIHADVTDGRRTSSLILLEHQPVFTAGKRTESSEFPTSASPAIAEIPVVQVDRGGKITWHGPGQLIGYPILKLKNPQELVGYVREIERAIIEILAEFDLTGVRVEGRSGVWIEGRRKIAAIGIRVAQGVTMHGFAINANCSLAAYEGIVPCGISDAEVTSLSTELAREVTISDLLPAVSEKMIPVLSNLALGVTA